MEENRFFSLSRWWAIVVKELLQLKRDRITFAMVIGIPVVQLLLFGYAINSDPKHLPAALVLGEQSPFTRSVEKALVHSEYFDIVTASSEEEAKKGLKRGEFQFVVSVPSDFSRELLRGSMPEILVQADAADPVAVGSAVGVLQNIVQVVGEKEFKGSLAYLQNAKKPFSVIVHKMYNPEGLTRYNIVPGLMGVVLTMTTVMMTSLAITRERERGTMENLLAAPVKSLEIMLGKMVPYVFIAHIQMGLIIFLAIFLFDVPFMGSAFCLYMATLLFILANLSVGIVLSSLAKNQLQSMQMTVFYFLPNIMLSGFMFPFAGMPDWAQFLGSFLPLTYFLRAVRGVFLKGSGFADTMGDIVPVAVFCLLMIFLATKIFRRTLD